MISSAVIIFLTAAAYGFIHSLLASLPAKARARRLFGPRADRFYRLGYNAFAVISILPLLAFTAALPARTLYRLPFPWSLVTLGIQILAFLALVLGVWQTGAGSFLGVRQLFDPMDTRTPRLVVRGLYRFVRHPIYTAGFLFMWFTPVMNTNLLALYAALTLYCMVGARLEEERLVTEFGEAYEAYRRQTPMLIPSPRSLSAEIIHHP